MSGRGYDLDFLPALRPVSGRPGVALPLLLLAIGVVFAAAAHRRRGETEARRAETLGLLEERARAATGAPDPLGAGGGGGTPREIVEQRAARIPWEAILASLAESLPAESRVERFAFEWEGGTLRIDVKGGGGDVGSALARSLASDTLFARRFPVVRSEEAGPSSFAILCENGGEP
ncbi:MAG: hypothetical protein ABIH26_14790 [Candidatus Eisenbacteria bacterium]